MAINFTSSVDNFTTTAARATRTKSFTEFTSKKKLEEANVLTAAQLGEVKKIKGTFTFALHTAGRYMVITLYHATAEKKYQFIILDLETNMVAEADSVKNAKAAVLELVQEQSSATQEEPASEEAPVEGTESEEPSAEPAEEPQRKGKRGGRKNADK